MESIRHAELSCDYGRYQKGEKVIVHKIDFYQGRYYLLCEMEDGELTMLEAEWVAIDGELKKEKIRQMKLLKERPDLIVNEEKIEKASEKIAKSFLKG